MACHLLQRRCTHADAHRAGTRKPSLLYSIGAEARVTYRNNQPRNVTHIELWGYGGHIYRKELLNPFRGACNHGINIEGRALPVSSPTAVVAWPWMHVLSSTLRDDIDYAMDASNIHTTLDNRFRADHSPACYRVAYTRCKTIYCAAWRHVAQTPYPVDQLRIT